MSKSRLHMYVAISLFYYGTEVTCHNMGIAKSLTIFIASQLSMMQCVLLITKHSENLTVCMVRK